MSGLHLRCEQRAGFLDFHAMRQVWAAVDRRIGVPLNATWAMTALAFIIGLPLLHSSETFFALASISSVGLNLSCESPATTPMLSCPPWREPESGWQPPSSKFCHMPSCQALLHQIDLKAVIIWAQGDSHPMPMLPSWPPGRLVLSCAPVALHLLHCPAHPMQSILVSSELSRIKRSNIMLPILPYQLCKSPLPMMCALGIPRSQLGICQERCRDRRCLIEGDLEIDRAPCLCADVAPIVLRLRKGKQFAPGAFHMGRVQPWVNAGALLFILFSTVRAPHSACPGGRAEHLRRRRLQPLLHTAMPGASGRQSGVVQQHSAP